MQPVVVIAIIRGVIKAPGEIIHWLKSPSRVELQRTNAEINNRLEKSENERRVKMAQINSEAIIAYEKGMKCWHGGVFSKPNKEEAKKWLQMAAKAGHVDAQMMAKMHGISY